MNYILNIEPLPVSEEFKNAVQGYYKLIDLIDLKLVSKSEVCGLYCRFSKNIGKDYLEQFPCVSFILCNATGTNHIDKEYCNSKNIEVYDLSNADCFLRGNITSSAEHTWGLLLAAARKFKKHQENLQLGLFNRNVDFGTQLKGKTLGIVGMGRNGTQLAEFALAFQMNVQYFDPLVSEKKIEKVDTLKDLFRNSDFIILSVKLTEETKFMINKRVLSNCNEVHLVNTSRGEIVVEEDILSAVDHNVLLSYSADVIVDELNYQSSKIFQRSLVDARVLLTPHIGGATLEAWGLTELYLANQLISCKW